jgi:hypothetical protein
MGYTLQHGTEENWLDIFSDRSRRSGPALADGEMDDVYVILHSEKIHFVYYNHFPVKKSRTVYNIQVVQWHIAKIIHSNTYQYNYFRDRVAFSSSAISSQHNSCIPPHIFNFTYMRLPLPHKNHTLYLSISPSHRRHRRRTWWCAWRPPRRSSGRRHAPVT